MTIFATPGATVEASVVNFPTGLTGTVRYRLLDNVGATTSGPTTTGIGEYPAGSGFYSVAFTAPTTAGEYSILWDTGTLGPGTTAAEALSVSYSAPSASAPSGDDLCTVADVRVLLEFASGDTSRDTLIQALITDASRMIRSFKAREFVAVGSTTRRFCVPVGAGIFDLDPYDLRAASAIVLHPESSGPVTLTANTDYVTRPLPSRYGVYTHLQFSRQLSWTGSNVSREFGFAFLDITATWGFAAVPGEAKDACALTVAAWMRRDMTAVAYNGALDMDTPEIGPMPGSAFTLPLAAKMKLDPFTRGISAV